MGDMADDFERQGLAEEARHRFEEEEEENVVKEMERRYSFGVLEWTSTGGQKVNVTSMDNNHVRNTCKMLARDYKKNLIADKWIELLKIELEKRGKLNLKTKTKIMNYELKTIVLIEQEITTSCTLQTYIGIKVKKLREEKKWQQKTLAKKAGVSNSCISIIESEDSGTIALATLEGVCRAFGCKSSDILPF